MEEKFKKHCVEIIRKKISEGISVKDIKQEDLIKELLQKGQELAKETKIEEKLQDKIKEHM